MEFARAIVALCRWSSGVRGCALGALVALALAGCGKSIQKSATEQLLLSDAVDQSVSSIDFRVLAGETVYFDTQFIANVKGAGFVNSEYIISSLRQQLVAANCRLQDKREEANYVVEARVGALGTDTHELIFGIPANNSLNAAASVLADAPSLPTIPEISLAKKNDQLAAAKIGVFAYNRETKAPVWQSGIAQAKSEAKDIWVMGAGPFQSGNIYDGTQFAGARLALPLADDEFGDNSSVIVAYDGEFNFREATLEELKLVSAEEEAKQSDDAEAEAADDQSADDGKSDKKSTDSPESGEASQEKKPAAKSPPEKTPPKDAKPAAADKPTTGGEPAGEKAPPPTAAKAPADADAEPRPFVIPDTSEPFFRLQTIMADEWIPDAQAVGWLSRVHAPPKALDQADEPPGTVMIRDVPHRLQLFTPTSELQHDFGADDQAEHPFHPAAN